MIPNSQDTAQHQKAALDAQKFPVPISKRPYPIPSRTRKSSSSEPMVLHGGPCGRVGRCRVNYPTPTGETQSGFFFWRDAAFDRRSTSEPECHGLLSCHTKPDGKSQRYVGAHRAVTGSCSSSLARLLSRVSPSSQPPPSQRL